MKKSVLIVAILLVVFAFCVNAEVIKKSALWGFGITGKVADETPSLSVQPINPNYPPCPATFSFTNKENITYGFDVKVLPNEVDINSPGVDSKYKLHFFESNSQNNKTIITKEFFVLTTKMGSQFTHILQYVGFNLADRTLTFHDLGTGTREITYDQTGRGDIVVGGKQFRVYIDPATQRIAIDQNANGILNGEETYITAMGGAMYNESYFTGNKNCLKPSVICSDSDKSSSYNMRIYGPDNLTLNRPDVFTFGKVNFNPPGKASIIINDACFNGTHLAEGFCQQDKYQGRQGITCPNGCKGGVCLTGAPASDTCTQFAADPDKKQFYDGCQQPGFETVCFNTSGIYQGCGWNDRNTCTENNVNAANNIVCPVTQLPPPQYPCQDSDNSPNYIRDDIPFPITPENNPAFFVKGFATGEFSTREPGIYNVEPNPSFPKPTTDPYSTVYDLCLGDTLAESFCWANGRIGSHGITCPNGCQNGACLASPAALACHDVEAEFHFSGPGAANNPLRIKLNTAVVFIVKNVEYLVNFANINGNTATFIVNGQQISLRPPQTKMLANRVSFKLLSLNNTPVCGSDGKNYESACIAGAAGAAVSCTGLCPCPPPEPVCSDSDGGLNFSSKGYVKTALGGGSDCCVDSKLQCGQNGSSVMELYCNPGSPTGFSEHIYQCSNGCVDGACIEQVVILGPPPVREIGEQVTCNFLFAKATHTCSSSKGSCSAPRNYAKCTVQVGGAPGEKVNWTSTCTVLGTASTTMDGTAENAVFICGQPPRIDIPPTWSWP